MIFRVSLRLLLFSFIFLTYSCDSMTKQKAEDDWYDEELDYSVKTIFNMDIAEFTERNSSEDSVYTFDWPLEIKLEDYKPGGMFKGSVMLANLGWIEVDTTINNAEKQFIVRTENKLGPVEFIVFTDLKITSDSLVGNFTNAGPTIDTGYISFTAERILN